MYNTQNSISVAANRSDDEVKTVHRDRVGRFFRWFAERPWILLPLFALPAIWPLLSPGLLRSADGELHLLRLITLDHQIRQGALYPRWTPELFTGLGHPLFSFYAPAAYYLAEALHVLGLSFLAAFKATFALLVVASGLGMYLLARRIFGMTQRWPALVSAVAYMYAPYLLTNLHMRGALPEVCAQALLPWIVLSLRGLALADKPGNYVLPVALSLGGLAVTHNITLLLAPSFLLSYVLVLWWTNGRSKERLLWLAGGFAVAAGVSAAFWLPLIVERGYVSSYAYEVAANTFIPENVWRWRNFLDTNLVFDYTLAIPFQLGLAQLVLACAGALLARRKDPEWLFLIAFSVLAGLGMGAWAEPLWLSNEMLLTVQFPWRLLGVMSIPLAIFTGAVVLRVKGQNMQLGASLALAALVVLANRPQVAWMDVIRFADAKGLAMPAVAQWEFETGALGTSYMREFMPRWSSGNRYDGEVDQPVDLTAVQVESAGRYGMALSIDSVSGGPLRFMNAYYPGWRVLLNQQALMTYPSTNLGLLTVDLPAGAHQVDLSWAGTPAQRAGEIISLLSLLGLAIFVGFYGDRRWLAALPLALLVMGMVAVYWQPRDAGVAAPAQPLSTADLTLLGYRVEQGNPFNLAIYPVWHARRTPPPDTRFRWELRDATGQRVAWTASRPFYNSLAANNWPAGTIVDDAHQLPLPPNLAAGRYELTAQVLSAHAENQTAPTTIGSVTIERDTPAEPVGPKPHTPLDVTFGSDIRLAGFDLERNKALVDPASLTIARPGDKLEYILYWRTLNPLAEDYSATVHIMDARGVHLVQQDHAAGDPFRPPTLWEGARLQRDRHVLEIPETAASGVYRAFVTLYQSSTGTSLGEGVWLPPVKIVKAESKTDPQYGAGARFSEMATLIGYDLALPEAGLRAGDQFTLTLYFRGDTSQPQDYTRFVHLYSAQHGMAAQHDSPPGDGRNPTSAWLPDEVIIDQVELTVAEDAIPGDYSLRVGMYDPIDGRRVAAFDEAGNAQPDGQVVLTNVSVER